MMLAASEEFDNRRKTLSSALTVLNKVSGASSRRAGSPRNTSCSWSWPRIGVSRERVRQIEVSAFEEVQNAVKNRVAAWRARHPAGVLASNPLPWWEKLPMDGTYRSGTFATTERRQ